MSWELLGIHPRRSMLTSKGRLETDHLSWDQGFEGVWSFSSTKKVYWERSLRSSVFLPKCRQSVRDPKWKCPPKALPPNICQNQDSKVSQYPFSMSSRSIAPLICWECPKLTSESMSVGGLKCMLYVLFLFEIRFGMVEDRLVCINHYASSWSSSVSYTIHAQPTTISNPPSVHTVSILLSVPSPSGRWPAINPPLANHQIINSSISTNQFKQPQPSVSTTTYQFNQLFYPTKQFK